MDSNRIVNPDPRRSLPSVGQLTQEVCAGAPDLPRWSVLAACKRLIEEARGRLAAGERAEPEPGWVSAAGAAARALAAPSPGRVVNATGVLLHTNLGRAPMARGAAEAAARVGEGYSDLELDLASGRRGNRLGRLAAKLEIASGAEAAHACNNNAGAVLLMLSSMAAGKEVIVSRGELVEIGGSFRVPAIMERAGVRLVEVGTTNRTHPRDYEDAIGPDTGLLLKVHRSNFHLSGFVTEVGIDELAVIGARHGVPVAEDLGSGSLVDLAPYGLPAESFAPGRLQLGADVVCFSGDKLLGGPQAGILLGRADLIRSMRSNPLARALRLDKMTLAALDWTLGVILDGRAEHELPFLQQLLASPADLEERSKALATKLSSASLPPGVSAQSQPDRAPVGGGSLPEFELDTFVVAVRAPGGADALATALRATTVPIVARVRDGAVLFDLRSLLPSDIDLVVSGLEEALR